MDTKEFMEAIGITSSSTLAALVKSGVVTPSKVGKSYVFGIENVKQYAYHMIGDSGREMLKQSFDSTRPDEQRQPDAVIFWFDNTPNEEI